MLLCCGEAVIDMLPDTASGLGFMPHTGGAAVNTAIALGRLGVPAGYFGGLSTDLFGAQLAEALLASDVDLSKAARSARPTTLAFVQLTDGHARYAFYDENTAGRMLSPADLPDLGDVRALLFGGISLAQEPAGAAFATLCAADHGLPVMIDPNIRPDIIRDAPGFRPRLEALLRRADIIKLSDEDLAWLGLSAQNLLDRHDALILITKGADGVDLHSRAGQLHVPAAPALVVDTVGAGDTFNAGFLAGLSRAGLLCRNALRDSDPAALLPAIQLGTQAAAITVSRAGANPPWSHEL
jgi:fructokinase